MIYQYQVSELVNNLKLTLEEVFPVFDITGEISSITLNQKSGHLYFSIKDNEASINCACWKSNVFKVKNFIVEGATVRIRGKISLFNNGAKLYINVLEAKPEGEGNIQKYLLELKNKLAHLGYFDNSNKQNIPSLPDSIGLITSLDGAVISDIKATMQNRFPTKAYLIDVPVQGGESIDKIIKAIQKFNSMKNPPAVLIIARGGGSEEDLFHFNNEELIKNIYLSKIPIITAIGHQPNSTLADMASDMSVATPTASVHFLPEISLLTKNINDLKQRLLKNNYDILKQLQLQLHSKKINNLLLKNIISTYNHKIISHQQNLYNLSNNKIINFSNSINSYSHNFNSIALNYINKNNLALHTTKQKLQNPHKIIAHYAENISIRSNKINNIYYNMQFYQNKLDATLRLLENLSFKRNLQRGYSIIFNKNKEIITSTAQLKDDNYYIELSDGIINTKISKNDVPET